VGEPYGAKVIKGKTNFKIYFKINIVLSTDPGIGFKRCHNKPAQNQANYYDRR